MDYIDIEISIVHVYTKKVQFQRGWMENDGTFFSQYHAIASEASRIFLGGALSEPFSGAECLPACTWTVVKLCKFWLRCTPSSYPLRTPHRGVLPPKPPGLVRFKRSVLRRDVPSAIVGGGQR